jgi:homoserine kinase type II
MSVFTKVTDTEAAAWLPPISEGIENTNYFLATTDSEFVLTLYERLPAEDLPFYLNFTAHLAGAGVAVPQPIMDRTGGLFSILNGKPAALTQRVNGRPQLNPTAKHCAAVGAELARLHLASQKFRGRLTNKRGPGWMLSTYRAVRSVLTAEQSKLIADELAYQRARRETRLPTGAIHADLFRDNVLFDGDRLAGIIDFGFAATDELAYDLAITVNDWCIDETSELDASRRDALLGAYAAIRPLTDPEISAWPALLRAGAIRFWLSRLYDLHFPRSAELNTPHDPGHFERILRARATRPSYWPL